MAVSNVTAQRVRELLDYDPLTGVFRWRASRSACKVKPGDIAGSLHSSGYVRIGVDYTICLAHRLAWLHVYGVWPGPILDHINTVKSDNRISNLRDVSPQVNQQNKRLPRANVTSKYLGVWWNTRQRKWVTGITAFGRRIHLGTFADEDAAYAAYLAAKRRHHEGCTL
jgi:hypothetical protein